MSFLELARAVLDGRRKRSSNERDCGTDGWIRASSGIPEPPNPAETCGICGQPANDCGRLYASTMDLVFGTWVHPYCHAPVEPPLPKITVRRGSVDFYPQVSPDEH